MNNLIALFTFLLFVLVANASITCTSHLIDVPSSQPIFQMAGTLCVNNGVGLSGPIIVLVSGATYNRTYWDFSIGSYDYCNFRMAMNNAGYATMVVDRLGTGQSSKPPSVVVTASLQADSVHTVIQQLKLGNIGGFNPQGCKIILGGHSLGSIISVLEASTYHDVDAVLLTGFAHGAVLPSPQFYPCMSDPQLSGCNDPTYFTTRPGSRKDLFYSPLTTNLSVVAYDEATKDLVTLNEFADGVTLGGIMPLSSQIYVPVLAAIGSNDKLFCTVPGACSSAIAYRATESPFYQSCPDFQTYVLQNSGHSMNLATNTNLFQQRVIQWLKYLGY